MKCQTPLSVSGECMKCQTHFLYLEATGIKCQVLFPDENLDNCMTNLHEMSSPPSYFLTEIETICMKCLVLFVC